MNSSLRNIVPLLLGTLLLLWLLAACGEDNSSSTPVPPAPTFEAEEEPAGTNVAAAPYPGGDASPAYPGASLTAVPTSTAASATGTPTPRTAITVEGEQYLPVVGAREEPTPTPTNTPLPSPTPTIDFQALRSELNANGQELTFFKFGFHASVGGNRNGLGEWMRRLDEAGVPFTLKSVGDAGPLLEAQNLARASGVPHVLIWRAGDTTLDVPDYSLPPLEAARKHWAIHSALFPPELDKSTIWVETVNEVDKNRSEWLAQFAIETARLALNDGFRWAAFGWSSGEPEVSDWESPQMLEFLRLVGANPDRLAVALHEHSFVPEDIAHQYPFKVGRFQFLFEVADRNGIPRPTVLITEWGWAYQETPPPTTALEHIRWAAEMYAPYPEIKGAAIWHLGCCFGDVADQTQRLIRPLTDVMLGEYFVIPMNETAPIDPAQWQP